MRFLKQFAFGGVIGLGIAIVVILAPLINFTEVVHGLLIVLLGVIILLWVIGFIFLRKTNKLSNLEVDGDEEDEVEVEKYTALADDMLSFQSSTVVALFVTCIALVTAKSVILTILGLVSIILSYIFIVYSVNQVRHHYSDRNIPNAMDPEYHEKLFEASDEGERHVMLQGFFKTHQMFNLSIVLGIVAATMYSLFAAESQIFSIAVMCVVLLIVNGKYYMTIRKKV